MIGSPAFPCVFHWVQRSRRHAFGVAHLECSETFGNYFDVRNERKLTVIEYSVYESQRVKRFFMKLVVGLSSLAFTVLAYTPSLRTLLRCFCLFILNGY